jgi:hypothetical protein
MAVQHRSVPMEVKRIHVNGNNEATIICHSCGKWKKANVARYLELKKPVKIKCSCEAVFSVAFEKRQFFRKKVKLYGTCSMHGMGEEEIFIKDISRGGLGFILNRGTIEKGNTLTVEFVLDNNARSAISENVIVKSVKDRFIGAEFVNPSENTKKLLGFYLLP